MISQGTAAATQRIAATRCLLRRAPLAVIIVCIAPLAILWPEFRNLYWFHDDWELLSEMQSSTSVAWLTRRYGENFAPLFKAMWQVAVLGTGGSYTAMILLLWVTHVAVLLLLGRLLRRCGFDWRAQCIALLTLGAAWSNIETLAWASCWISELSILFLLAAWNFAVEQGQTARVLAALFSAAGALTFSRGVFTGALLAAYLALSAYGRRESFRLRPIAFFTGVTVLALVPYAWMLPGYSHANASALGPMLAYGARYLALNPLYQLMPLHHDNPGLGITLFVAGFKYFVVAAGLWFAEREQRPLLCTLLLFDLLMAAMVGFGRFDRASITAASSRYQYPALLCFGPFAGVAAVGITSVFFHAARQPALATGFVLWAVLLTAQWPRQMRRWSAGRGTEVRSALAKAADGDRFGPANITAGRARELIRVYHLH